MLDYYLYRIGQFISLILPLKLVYAIAVFLADLYYSFAFRDRRAVLANLKAIFPDKPAKELRKICRRVFQNFAKYLCDFFRFQKIDAGYIKSNIQVKNRHYLDETLRKGKGAVILTAHLGNWELGGAVIAQLGYPFWVVALPHKVKKVNDFFDAQRQSKGVKIIPVGKAVRDCISQIKKNNFIALVGDRDFSEKGIILDLFGKPTHFPEGPAALSLITRSPIVPGFMLRNKDDSFTLSFEQPLDFEPGKEREKDIADLISCYKIIFEDYIRKYPEQWYIFQKFWVEE